LSFVKSLIRQHAKDFDDAMNDLFASRNLVWGSGSPKLFILFPQLRYKNEKQKSMHSTPQLENLCTDLKPVIRCENSAIDFILKELSMG